MENNKKFIELRNTYKEFNYESYTYKFNNNFLEICFEFSQYDGIKFIPTLKIPIAEESYINKNKKFIDEIIFNLGMVELISYWKATCSPVVNVKCNSLTEKQKTWWKKLFYNGLGEFFYTNGISISQDEFMQIKSEKTDKLQIVIDDTFDGALIPIGGGKDSIVTLETLKNKSNNLCYIINPRGATLETVKVANYYGETVFANRSIDSNLLELNKQGFLNGHTPFSAMLAFSSYLVAYLYDKRYIALSNESSANESNVKGTNINHQYSKSIEFENDFREYVKENLSDKIEYFSFLRPLNEFRIIEKFCNYPQYFNIFKSCNVGSKEDIWCCNCPKCLYVFIMLSAFLEIEELVDIFGINMFENIKLSNVLDGLVSENYDKPFECVGTKEEINYALYVKIKKIKEENINMPALLNYYMDNYNQIYNDIDKSNNNDNILKYYDEINNVPLEYKELI